VLRAPLSPPPPPPRPLHHPRLPYRPVQFAVQGGLSHVDANNILTVVNRGPVPHVPSLLGRSAPEGLCRGRVSALLPLGDALCTTGRDSRSPQEGVLVLQSAALLIAERVAGQTPGSTGVGTRRMMRSVIGGTGGAEQRMVMGRTVKCRA